MIESSKTYTIEQFIDSEPSTKISYDTFSFYEKVDTDYIITHNILDDYREEILSACEENDVELSQKEFFKYSQRPKLLAHDIYGNGELFFIILFINNICDVKEFNKKHIKLIKKSKLNEILSAIYNNQSSALQKNRNNIEV